MKINLSKKNYVISAGADGLGFAIANKIINSGGKVYLSDINKSKIDKINSNKKYYNKGKDKLIRNYGLGAQILKNLKNLMLKELN